MRTGSHHPAWRSRRTLTRAVILTAASLTAANCLPSLPGASSPRLSERDRVTHLLSRTTYGVRPQDVEEAMRLGRREWLERQLHPEAISDVTLETRIASRPTPPADQRIAELKVRPPVAPSPQATMPNAAIPDPAAARALSQALETAVQRLEAAQQDLLAAQRLAVTAQERATSSDLSAARAALQEALDRYRAAQQSQNTAQQSFDSVLRRMSELTTPPTPIPNAVRTPAPVRIAALTSALSVNALVASKLDRAVYSERQLEEVMTDFWFNHFNVYYNKGQVRLAVEDYEKNAIRKHVFGRFQDLLVATAQHPAMLVYLDNFQSTAPVAQQPANGRPARAQRGGLNENYARELMELHTLGVDGGYTQQDVIEVARAFTGWGIVNRRTGGEPGSTTPAQSTIDFQFNANSHDNGNKVVLGQPIAGGRGIDEGMEILGILAHHPSTAKHIATKLVRHFVSDDPPPELVDEIARVFLETDGDLAAVTRALFLSNEFYNPDHYREKVKRPFEYVASALRVTGADIVNQGQGLVPQLRSFRHLPYSEAAPTGYATTADDWVSAGAMLARMNFGLDLVGGRLPGISLGPRGSSGAVLPAALPMDAGFDISVGVDGMPSPSLQSSVQALLQQISVGAQTDQLAQLITEDLVRAPQAGAGTGAVPQGGVGRGGVPQEGVVQRSAPGGRPGAALVQRRGSANQALPPALRALGLALGSPEFQRY